MKSLLCPIPLLRRLRVSGSSSAILAALILVVGVSAVQGQNNGGLTPIQREIEKLRQRLSSGDTEERRDALMRLGSLKRTDASRIAVSALSDLEPVVRVTAAHAILSLPPTEVVTLLDSLLQDKLEFVRREAAYALGQTRNRAALSRLTNLLASDKDAGVRGAAAVALGEIGEESAVPFLSQVLTGRTEKKKKVAEDAFVMRAAARSLGQIRSRAAVDVLIATLANDANDPDLRREAATALGLIGDPAAEPALQAAFSSSDPYLSAAARESLRRIKLARK